MPSTAIGRIDYDDETQRLFVEFVANGRRPRGWTPAPKGPEDRGKTYVYFDVPPDAYEAFRHAFSKGTWFNTHIRDHYRHSLVSDPRAKTG